LPVTALTNFKFHFGISYAFFEFSSFKILQFKCLYFQFYLGDATGSKIFFCWESAVVAGVEKAGWEIMYLNLLSSIPITNR